jgi:hypothetical protein
VFDLAGGAKRASRTRRPTTAQRVQLSMQRILDTMAGVPAWIRNHRLDFLAANRLGYALHSEMFTDAARPANTARFVFLNGRSREFFIDWERVAGDIVATLRAEAGRNPYDRGLSDLVGELSTRSEAFRTRSAAHNVRRHRTGLKLQLDRIDAQPNRQIIHTALHGKCAGGGIGSANRVLGRRSALRDGQFRDG